MPSWKKSTHLLKIKVQISGIPYPFQSNLTSNSLSTSPQDQFSVLCNQSFVRTLEDVISQLISSTIPIAEHEKLTKRKADLIDNFETINHLKALLVNPQNLLIMIQIIT
jgi:hypothetical protein